MSKEKNNEDVIINAAPGTALIYCCLCAVISASLLGYLEKGSAIAVGVLQLGIFVGYTLGALFVFKAGNQVAGNTFFIFAALFGGASGMLNTVGGIMDSIGIPFAWSVMGLMNIVAGAILVIITIANRNTSKADFLIIFFAAIGVLGAGISSFTTLTIVPTISGIALGIDGVIAFYMAAAGILQLSGIDVSFGKPLVEKKGMLLDYPNQRA